MTTTKKQLFVALVMMLVSAVALGTATYAWFVNNAAPSVESMNFNASTSTSLEIAVDTNADSTGLSTTGTPSSNLVYKGLITNNDIKAYNHNAYSTIFTELLAPASIAKFTAAAVDNKFYGVNGYNDSWLANKFQEVAPGAGSVKKIPIWFRSTTAMKVYLKAGDTTITTSKPSNGNSLSAQMDKALRIAFVDDANPGNYVIFDVNGAPITESGISRNTTVNSAGVYATDGDAIGSLDADGKIESFVTQDKHALTGYEVTDDNAANNMVDAAEASGKTPLFTLEANKPMLIDVYIWLEGCDYDCVNEIAGGLLTANLKFIGGN